jgi:hypothetical protein
MWFNWSKDPGNSRRRMRLKYMTKPIRGGKFIVIDERNQVALRVLQGLVPRKSNILL